MKVTPKDVAWELARSADLADGPSVCLMRDCCKGHTDLAARIERVLEACGPPVPPGREALRWTAAYGRALERHGFHVATIKRCHELADRAYEELFHASPEPSDDKTTKESHGSQ